MFEIWFQSVDEISEDSRMVAYAATLEAAREVWDALKNSEASFRMLSARP